MKKIEIQIRCKELPADTVTPVGIYLRLRDRFPGCLLLESSDSHAAQNSYSFICVKPVAGIRVEKTDNGFSRTLNCPGEAAQTASIERAEIPGTLDEYLRSFELKGEVPVKAAAGLFGFTSYDAVQAFETISLRDRETKSNLPLLRYDLFRYVIAIDHFYDRLFICENLCDGENPETEEIETLIGNKNIPVFPFALQGEESSNFTDAEYLELVDKARAHCRRGDVFQLVFSRRFRRTFTGDEFNVYRALRSINPSPYLFYFDYGSYKIFGSSPEAQLQIDGGKAIIHPIAGTFRRTGNEQADRALAEKLLLDPKENAEHVMLVDLARNDLSRHSNEVQVDSFREIQYYSHVIHLVSKVSGKLENSDRPFRLLADTFPAGTLTGAPKYKAMELADRYENVSRSFYGGCIGFAGFGGDFNHAIVIRSFLSEQNTLTYQAGAGIVAQSEPQSELMEVSHKLNALRAALDKAPRLFANAKAEKYIVQPQ
ncbi:MAG: anthranilate synthase component I [Bacteroidetes bacterium]|nr:MAG: anthranilate synthase component I [Bacteroidota bacterium]